MSAELETVMPDADPGDGELAPYLEELLAGYRAELLATADRIDALKQLLAIARSHESTYGRPMLASEVRPYGLDELEDAHRAALIARSIPEGRTP